MTWRPLFHIIAFLVLFLSFEAKAEIFRYTDDGGVSHFVDDVSLVPEKYRSQLKDSKPLPDLNISKPVAPPVEYRTNTSQDMKSKKKQKKEVEVFMTSWCPHCSKLVAALDARNIRYQKYDIEKDMNAKREYEELGLRGVPVTRVGSHIISGNNPDAIVKILYEE